LSAREITVLELLADGLTDREFASHLGISRFTIYQHVRAIIQKLDAVSRTDAAVKAIKRGVID
jgi:DNA-binding CsgD family transcriptional regulator